MRDPTADELEQHYDSPLERLQLLGGDDQAIAAFLDEIDVRGPRDREMLRELARPTPLARPDRFPSDHRRVLVALESLRRHGHHGARAGEELGPLRTPVRYLIELVARYVVVTHCKNVALTIRNLYWLREMQSEPGSVERELLQPARLDAQALVEIARGREIGVPTFVIGGLLIPAGLSVWRLASGTVREWWIALLAGAIAALVGLLSPGSSCAAPRSRAGGSDSPSRSRSRSCGPASAAVARRRRISRGGSPSWRSRSRSVYGSCCRSS